jgi:hypothetical protein
VCGRADDDVLPMMQVCTVASAPQLQVSTGQSVESSTLEDTPSSRPVAELVGESTPPEERSWIRWTARWDLKHLDSQSRMW